MKLNEKVEIVAKKCILVPYEPCHVEKYHKWMEDEEIRRLTGSERLTIEEEYEMQRSWREDEDKLTFIVLSKENELDETSRMLGDVNLFISKSTSSEDESEEVTEGEVEIMIAEASGRGKGIGEEAVSLIISWAYKNLSICVFRARITDDNTPSLSLFEKKLGFNRIKHSSAFKEYTLELPQKRLISHFSTFLDQNSQICEYKIKK
ncbi:hypothetical protein GCK72_011626 [Caenorhabditis remanei]|uniref:N-acetyltransferase domain-containing protein n=1 Tax=Caenorhabditis remanei TaxID=31234 RepID=A0A6A5H6A5_CAERE|nr:hypothetical protein GCK72_011626 [Caenorhabditis remanei]KAF1763360.1 hypothetical protein GCK72_011626 [Caenorhabditis remanei]